MNGAPLLMGIVNVTPDSFSDGGAFLDPQKAVDHACRLLDEGAAIIDIGGESTRPGAAPVDMHDEQARVLPVLDALVKKGAHVSVDTRNAGTMRAVIDRGARMINDISALTHDAQALASVASSDVSVCLMHMQGDPRTMQENPVYDDVVEDVFAYLHARIAACEAAGIARARIVADPGFGFGKTYDHNIALLEGFARFHDLGVTLLAGVSRKRFIAQMMGQPDLKPAQRIEGSLRAAKMLADAGAGILRVHDVAQTAAHLGLRQSVF